MAEQHPTEGSSSSNVSGEGSENSVVELNIKTLESQIHKFKVDKNMLVSAFKEKIADEIGMPVVQQRLIFRGKVLKDDHLLSEYHVENGVTLHLVARQLAQSQSETGSGETRNEASTGTIPNRVGVSHSVVLGTFNVGEQGEGIVPDISRVIGAVLNSFGMGGQISGNNTSGAPPAMANMSGQAVQGNQNQDRAGSQSQSGQTNPGQSAPQGVQIPLTAGAFPIPSFHAPTPDSLNMLVEFMNRMEQAISQNGDPPTSSPSGAEDIRRVELPSSERGVPTPEALIIVLRRAQQLLSNHATTALSHMAERLEQGGNSSDRTVRGQIQVESARLGLVMQHLGSLLLELGRAISTLRMGQSPAESSVNAGPAIYISPSGPNPIMVHPFPFQPSQLFGGSTPSNSMSFAPVGIGSTPRNVNIHIHAGRSPVISAVGSRAGSGDMLQGQRNNGDSSGAVRNVVTAVPRQVSTATQPGLGSQTSPDNTDINTLLRSIISGQGNNNTSSGQVDSSTHGSGRNEHSSVPAHGGPESAKDTGSLRTMPTSMVGGSVASSSSESGEGSENERVPLGLGLGGLERKKRSKQPESDKSPVTQKTKSLGGQTSSQQQLLQSLASGLGTNRAATSNSPGPMVSSDAMSQALQSPALNGLLAGFSEQTGVGSPDVLRTMLQQFSQNPEIMNTVSQIAQQVDGQELGDVFSGRGGAQGGLDLSRMVQQMMPVVSRALSHGASGSQSFPSMETGLRQLDDQRPSVDVKSDDRNLPVNVRDVAERIENFGTPENIFRAVIQNTTRLYGDNDGSIQALADELCSNPSLANEYVGLLQRDISRRIQDEQDKAEE